MINKRVFLKNMMLSLTGLGLFNSKLEASKPTESEKLNPFVKVNNAQRNIYEWENFVINDDWSNAFSKANEWAKSVGGAEIIVPAGKYYAQLTLSSNVYWRGAGKGITIITQKNHTNKDIVITEDFEKLSKTGLLIHAPFNFGLENITIDGNYLSDYRTASIGGDSVYNNTVGTGIKIIGSKFKIDLEIVNCAENGFYSEAVGYNGYSLEKDSFISISGRVFGKEAMVFRGPSDIVLNHIVLGCAGWLATSEERDNKIVMSNIYPSEPVSVFISDESNIEGEQSYSGHHEFVFMHLYGNKNGYGYKSINSGRLKGSHLICENCRGGVYLGKRNWGAIEIIDCHNNGRLPIKLSGVISSYPDLSINTMQSMRVNATIRRSKVESTKTLALQAKCKMADINLSFYSITSSPEQSDLSDVLSEQSNIAITCRDLVGDVMKFSGDGNFIKINAKSVSNGTVMRFTKSHYSNSMNFIDIQSIDCDNIISNLNHSKNNIINILGSLKPNQAIFDTNYTEGIIKSNEITKIVSTSI